MKNQHRFILASLLFAFTIQNTRSQTCLDCWHYGGDYVNGQAYIGTVNTHPFVIATGSLPRVIVDSSGNVFIGTGKPCVVSSKGVSLEVFGTIAANRIVITYDDAPQDLLSLITELQQEIAELKQRLAVAEAKQ